MSAPAAWTRRKRSSSAWQLEPWTGRRLPSGSAGPSGRRPDSGRHNPRLLLTGARARRPAAGYVPQDGGGRRRPPQQKCRALGSLARSPRQPPCTTQFRTEGIWWAPLLEPHPPKIPRLAPRASNLPRHGGGVQGGAPPPRARRGPRRPAAAGGGGGGGPPPPRPGRGGGAPPGGRGGGPPPRGGGTER